MKASVLVDNKSNGSLKGEWGLSILIDTGSRRVLLDTGASDLFIDNSKKLGLFDALCDTDAAVLSHAHYDHGNGIEAFFGINSRAKLYVGRNCDENCYIRKWIFRKYIGIPKNIMSRFSERIVPVIEKTQICDNVYIIPHSTPDLDKIGIREKMYIRRNSRWLPDDFSHEHTVAVRTEQGLVIFNSCSHGGTVNIINEVTEAFPGEKICAYIGGFHLFNKTEDEVRLTAKRLKETGVGYICTGHCTGENALSILREELGDVLHTLYSGMVIEI
ncbi:MAG: MBL fold metallo-hydrolase [Clostridiales bacterium]|nr:MBL fold metallo-hydrolase [Clostridiales bacterium]